MTDKKIAQLCYDEIYRLLTDGSDGNPSATAVEIIQRHLDLAVKDSRKDERQVHHLKSWPEAYQPAVEGRKRHEYRKNDRNYREHDELVLQEWDPNSKTYSGRSFRCKVLYIAYGPAWGIPEGHCTMSISDPYDIKEPQ